MKSNQRIKAVIDLDAVEKNFEAMHNQIRPETGMIAVIKADAYGHGAVPIAHLIENYDYIWGFAVATAEEALELRQNQIKKPVLILGHVFEEDLPELAYAEVSIAVSSLSMARAYAEAGKKVDKPVKIHLAVDTGMSRIGFADRPESLVEIREISSLEGLSIEGIFTHFARADEADSTPAIMQLVRFESFLTMLDKEGIQIPFRHCSNSAGLIRLPQANMDLVRAGISIYGIYPSEDVPKEVRLTPVMELKSHISFVKTVPAQTEVSYGGTFVTERETRLATIPVGYADGYPRQLSNKGWVLIHGLRAPICGRVCMDQFMVDVTDIDDVREGDEVTLMGRDQEGFISVEALGLMSGRFPYEFVCDISKRVPREYIRRPQTEDQPD